MRGFSKRWSKTIPSRHSNMSMIVDSLSVWVELMSDAEGNNKVPC